MERAAERIFFRSRQRAAERLRRVRGALAFASRDETIASSLIEIRSRICSGTGISTAPLPSVARTICTALCPTWTSSGVRVSARTVIWSGVTMPCTTASPSPQLELITSSSFASVSGLPVNITPDASEITIRCTTTPIRA